MTPYEISKAYRQSVIYRGDWIQAVGKTGVPTTLVQFEELMYLFANNDPDKNGKKDTYGLSTSGLNMVYGAYGYVPGQWNNKSGQLAYSSIQPEMKDALAVLAKWYKDGVLDPEFITGENKGGYWALSHAFTEGHIGYSSHGNFYHWDIEDPNGGTMYMEMVKTNPVGANSMVWGVPVTGPGSKKGLSMGNPVGSATNGYGIQLEKQPEKMAKILDIQNWITSEPENYIFTSFGFQGIDWDYNAAGAPARKPGVEPTYIALQGGHNVMIRHMSSRTSKAVDPGRPSFLESHNMYTDGYMNELIVSLPSAVIYQTEINKIESEAYIAIITGERPLSYFDPFVAQWRSAGGDVLTKQPNDWWNTTK
jgi:putative aldouronate transport system substrate-binding protein